MPEVYAKKMEKNRKFSIKLLWQTDNALLTGHLPYLKLDSAMVYGRRKNECKIRM